MLKQLARHFLRRTFSIEVVRKGSGWSLIEQEQLERFFEKFEVDCVFDVGANVGQYAERIFSTHYPGVVVSFEPNPDAIAVLERKAAANPRWRVFP